MSKPGYADQGFWFRVIFMLLYWVVAKYCGDCVWYFAVVK